jgi:DNA-binding NarL/FixJ family response regulator
MHTKCRVVIAEDHTIVREGLRALLLASSDFEIVAEAENGREVIQRATESVPNLILMDLSMPGMNGIEAIREIRSNHPQIKILVLTVHTNEEYIHACIQNGANGYIVKDASRTELLTAIRNVLAGKTHFCSEATEKIVTWYLHGTRVATPVSPWEALTHRERQILKLIAEGNTNKRIGSFLDISTKTVEKHRANLMEKLNLHSTAALTAFAVKKGLTDQWTVALCILALLSSLIDLVPDLDFLPL